MLRDGSMFFIDCSKVEDALELTLNSRSGLGWLIDNAPMDFVGLALDGGLSAYLKRVSDPHSGIDGHS